MNRTLILLIALLAASVAVGWRMGGSLGVGVVAGALCGGSLAALGASWQRHVIKTRPERAMSASIEVFLVKMACVVGAAMVFRFVEPAASRVDWRSFLVSFAICVFVVMIAGVFENANALKQASGRARALRAERELEASIAERPVGERGAL